MNENKKPSMPNDNPATHDFGCDCYLCRCERRQKQEMIAQMDNMEKGLQVHPRMKTTTVAKAEREIKRRLFKMRLKIATLIYQRLVTDEIIAKTLSKVEEGPIDYKMAACVAIEAADALIAAIDETNNIPIPPYDDGTKKGDKPCNHPLWKSPSDGSDGIERCMVCGVFKDELDKEKWDCSKQGHSIISDRYSSRCLHCGTTV